MSLCAHVTHLPIGYTKERKLIRGGKQQMEITLDTVCADYILYKASGEINGHIEAQFDDGVFNGVITNQTEDEKENIEIEHITDQKVFSFIKEKAIKDYNNNIGGVTK